MRRRKDANQDEIVRALRDAGASVFILSDVGHGFPDLLVGLAGRNYLLECKSPPIRMTEDELWFQYGWRGQVAIVTNVDEALGVVGLVDGREQAG